MRSKHRQEQLVISEAKKIEYKNHLPKKYRTQTFSYHVEHLLLSQVGSLRRMNCIFFASSSCLSLFFCSFCPVFIQDFRFPVNQCWRKSSGPCAWQHVWCNQLSRRLEFPSASLAPRSPSRTREFLTKVSTDSLQGVAVYAVLIE